jgi:predicted phosphodiesterase
LTSLRYGVIADVHGNLHALESALDVLSQAHVDRYLCLGDLVGYGPFPNECVRRMAELDVVAVAGNHDLIAAGRLGDERCSPFARESLRWTSGVLEDDVRLHLQALPLIARPDTAIVMAHGSLEDPERYVTRSEQIRRELDRVGRDYRDASLLLLGHTHHVIARGERSGALLRRGSSTVTLPADERVLLNPGSVGQSRELSPNGRVAVLDSESQEVTFLSVRYEVAACRAALRARGLPASSCHRKPYTLRAMAKRTRGLVGRTGRRLVGAAR